MNKDQIIDAVYQNYKKEMLYHPEENWLDNGVGGKSYRQLSKEEFINKCKTDTDFSKVWGLKIEERELSWEERWDLSEKYGYRKKGGEMPNETETFNGVNEREEFNSMMNDPVMGINLPTRLITITYNNETIESYE